MDICDHNGRRNLALCAGTVSCDQGQGCLTSLGDPAGGRGRVPDLLGRDYHRLYNFPAAWI